MALPKWISISDSVSVRVARTLKTAARRKFSAFSLAELIVVIAVLAILATIGFLSLSTYRSSALDAKGAANVRSVLTAISAESATYGKSPREFVIHDDEYALSGSAVVVFDGIPSILVPGPYWAPWTNYSAGNPDYAKLKLDPERFRVSFRTDAARLFVNAFSWFPSVTADAANPDYVLVGATDVTDASSGKPRPLSFVQTAGILSTSAAFVVGDYPAWMEGSVGGLIRDPEDPSGTWALVDGAETWGPAPCESAEVSWYDVPGLASWESATVEKATGDGVVRATATCSFSKISISAASAVCDAGYVASNVGTEPSCVADVCGSTVPSNAASTATSQAVSWTWHHSATAGQCTFACVAGYDWDGSACRASCPTPLSVTRSWLPYSFSQTVSVPNGQSATLTGTHSFGTAPENGTLSASFWFACADGSTTVSAADGPASCQTNLTWNGSRTAPACAPDTRSATCGWTVPTNGSATTAATYQQAWDGLSAAWLPEESWTVWAAVCWYSCNANYVPSGGSCVWGTQSASCTGLPTNAVWNSVSSVTQTWDGSAWAPSSAGTYSATASTANCFFKCSPNYTWNGVSCQADTKTFSCAAKPATGTSWNTVSSYLQTWNGSAWAPADSVTSYSTSASAAACRYQCSSGYGWDGALCQASVWGSCWTATAASYSYPTANWCAAGTKTDADTAGTDGSFDWTCSGAYGGTAATCSSPKKQDGVCGTSNGAALASAPSANLCSVGTASAVTGTGPWNWTCAGVNSGTSASCSASQASYAVSGTFGAGGAGATVSVCWANVTADASGNFSRSGIPHGTACNNVLATRTGYSCSTTTNGPASLTAAVSNVAGSCSINSYAVSGTFGVNANGATVSVCGSNVTAATDWSFSRTGIPYGTACNNVLATRTGYSCSTTTNGPASLTAAVSNVAGSCSINSYAVSGTFGATSSWATVAWCGKSATANSTGAFSFGSVAYGTVCNNVSATKTNYTCSVTTNWPATLGAAAITNIAGNCVANTQSASCTGLPTNAVWNSVSSVTQTWDGSAWAPATAGTYSATASTSSCFFKCSPNYTWNGVSCQADTKTFSCAAKPATGTSWNTVSSYLQTWNGSAWAPADSATSYSTSASAAVCRYQCSSGYGWDGALCQASVWGSCWTATAASYSYPTANWCASGTKTDADTAGTDGAFDWTCSGQYGGTAASCSSPKKQDGACGSSNGAALASAPSANLCSVGTASAVTGTGPWNWTCAGVNSGTSASCSASKITYVVTWNGNGGTGHTPASQSVAHGSGVGTLPTSPTRAGYAFDGWFTSTGGTTQVTTWSPTITAAISFYAQWAQNPACGTSNAVATTDPPTANLCSVGTASAITSTASTFNWTCSNAPATADSCSAPRRFSVTWNGNSWTPSEASRVVTYNAAVWTLPTATRTGYSFNGWFTATSGGTQITTATAITAAVTYYAQWTQLTYAVSGSFGANANGATVSVCGSNVTAATDGSFSRTGIPYGTACNNVAATRTNYTCSTTTNGPASLTAAVTNVAGSCTAGTQTYTCAAKPATGTDWNTVSSYIQTWNGSAWSPAASTTAYNATASTTACRYKCSTAYGWDTGTSICKASVNGACSTTAGACTAGTVSWDNGATACGTTRTWSCAGQYGGTTASCSKANAACACQYQTIEYYGCMWGQTTACTSLWTWWSFDTNVTAYCVGDMNSGCYACGNGQGVAYEGTIRCKKWCP